MTSSAKTKIISRKLEFQGWHKLETIVVQPASLKHEGLTAPMKREMYYCGTCVVILPYLPETDEILLNEQFRVGALMAGDPDPWLYECAAGMVDEGETPEEAAKRELLEETGCHAAELEFIVKSYPSPGGTDEIQLMYCARLDKAEVGHYGLEEEGEEIKTHLFPASEVLRMLKAGEITNGALITCLFWFANNHERLRKKWSKK